jgi:hypothetical protein
MEAVIKLLFKINLLLVLAVLSLHAQSQDSIALQPFHEINIFGRLEVKLNQRPDESIKIKCDSLNRSSVNYEVKDGILKIGLLSEFPPEIQIIVEVNFKHLDRISIGGGSKVYNRGVLEAKLINLKIGTGCELDLLTKVDSANIKVTKGGFVRLTGDCRAINLKTATKGVFRGTDLKNKSVTAKMNGGKAFVSATKMIDVKATMQAKLFYLGDPKILKQKVKTGAIVSQYEDDNQEE